MTKNQFEKRMRDIGKDTLADNPGMEIQDCAYDLARQLLKEIIADYIAG